MRIRLIVLALCVPCVLPAQAPAKPNAPAATTTQSAEPAGPYAVVDAYADSAPAAATRSVAALAGYLARVGSDDASRARAVFRWVATNIAYDERGLRTGDYGDVSPEGVLRRRMAVCQGYSALVQGLGRAMGLEVQIVTGLSKGYRYVAGQRVGRESVHAWNAVRVDGQWRLLEATWGAGFLDQGTFVRRFVNHWFLTPPDEFVYDHLPDDSRWLLMDHAVSADQFAALPYLRPMFFEAGMRLGSHRQARIETTDRVTVTLGLTRPVKVAAFLVNETSGRPMMGATLAQYADSTAQILAAFPRAGEYTLRVFGAMPGRDTLNWVMDYRVRASRGAPDVTFPDALLMAGPRGALLLEPMTGILRAGQTVRFRIRVPDAVSAAIGIETSWTPLARSGDEFVGDVPVQAGNVVVFATYPGLATPAGLWRFTAR